MSQNDILWCPKVDIAAASQNAGDIFAGDQSLTTPILDLAALSYPDYFFVTVTQDSGTSVALRAGLGCSFSLEIVE
jgi:hypothetical protein